MASRDNRLAEIAASLKAGYVTAEQRVESFVRTAIERRVYRPGDRIPQETIAQSLGISRIPVRAGLRQLESEGLVTVVPHRGATVVSMSASDIAEVFEFRKILECYLLERCIPRLSEQTLSALRKIAEELEIAPEQEYGRLQVLFYEELYSCADRPRAMKVLVGLRNEIERYQLSGRILEVGSCHSELLDHLAARDLGATQSWLCHHLDVVSSAVQAVAEAEFVEVSGSSSPESQFLPYASRSSYATDASTPSETGSIS